MDFEHTKYDTINSDETQFISDIKAILYIASKKHIKPLTFIKLSAIGF